MNFHVRSFVHFGAVCLSLLCCLQAWPQEKSGDGPWKFAVSGDSRNCGDVVMPAIAASALQQQVKFYWHLGDFRLMSDIDEDMAQRYGAGLTLTEYRGLAWGDFIAHQVAPFGLLPVYLGIGNHELYGRAEADYVAAFGYWLNTPRLRRQRQADNPASDFTYYHWQQNHVDFITLDNAPEEGFSGAQLHWLQGVLAKDKTEDSGILSIVVGMHRALPNSLACGHSMNGDADSRPDIAARSLRSGRQAYQALWKWHQETGKRVYILASHSHFFMERIFETPYWKDKVLPGWIVGTAGAQRYPLPEGLPKDIRAESPVAGYLLATVQPDGEIKFDFQKVTETEAPKSVAEEFGDQFVRACFLENKWPKDRKPPQLPASCSDPAPPPDK